LTSKTKIIGEVEIHLKRFVISKQYQRRITGAEK
jgi:hypothetical protein